MALHPVGFTRPPRLPGTPVGSYPTISPITCVREDHRLDCFLLHLPSPEGAFPLGSTVPFGVRTFLADSVDAVIRPTLTYESNSELVSSNNSASTIIRPVCSQAMIRFRWRIST